MTNEPGGGDLRPDQAEYLVGGWATNSLTGRERSVLMRAALTDDRIFEALVEEEDMRIALADEEFRDHLRARLSHSLLPAAASWKDRIAALGRRVFGAPWLTAAGAAAALVVVLLIRQGVLPESSPLAQVVLGPVTMPVLHSAGLLSLPTASEQTLETGSSSAPPAAAGGVTIGLDRPGASPTYSTGDRQRIGFRLEAPGSALLIEERADGSRVRLYPNRFQESPQVEAGRTILVPPAGQGDLEVDGPAGPRTLRLLIFPEGVDPLSPAADWSSLRARARVAEKRYSVVP